MSVGKSAEGRVGDRGEARATGRSRFSVALFGDDVIDVGTRRGVAHAAPRMSSAPGASDAVPATTTTRAPSRHAARFADKLAFARGELARLTTPYAAEVRALLEAGRVQVLPFSRMTRADFAELCRYRDFATELHSTDAALYRQLRAEDPRLLRLIDKAFYGFQCGARLFLSVEQAPTEFTNTIAHETKHFLRRADLTDFTDPQVVREEEQAAYEAEILLRRDRVTPAERRAIVEMLEQAPPIAAAVS